MARKSLRVRVQTSIRCPRQSALTFRVQEDVLPFTLCSGIGVKCSNHTLDVTAACPKGEAESFRRLVRSVVRPPLLGKKKR